MRDSCRRRSPQARLRAREGDADGAEKLLEKYPINCRGSAFELKARGPGVVETTIYSPEPDATAMAIAARLENRLKDPSSSGAEACAIA